MTLFMYYKRFTVAGIMNFESYYINRSSFYVALSINFDARLPGNNIAFDSYLRISTELKDVCG